MREIIIFYRNTDYLKLKFFLQVENHFIDVWINMIHN